MRGWCLGSVNFFTESDAGGTYRAGDYKKKRVFLQTNIKQI